MLQFPCETIVREILPAFKAFIVKELYYKYHYSQSQISEVLGITQASVSYYLHGERGSAAFKMIHHNEEIRKKLVFLIEAFVKNLEKPEQLVNEICKICLSFDHMLKCKSHPIKK